MNVPFDTLDYAKKLEQAGLPSQQAEQQSKLLAEVLGKSVAFPGDFVTLQRSLDSGLAQLDAKLAKSELRFEGRISTQNWMLTTIIAINIAMMLKLFLR